MFMIKILGNRSMVALIVSAAVLATLMAVAVLQGPPAPTQTMNNIEVLQKAMMAKDAKICDQIKGDIRRDEIDYTESEATLEKNVDTISEAEAKKRCRDGVKQTIEYHQKQQENQ